MAVQFFFLEPRPVSMCATMLKGYPAAATVCGGKLGRSILHHAAAAKDGSWFLLKKEFFVVFKNTRNTHVRSRMHMCVLVSKYAFVFKSRASCAFQAPPCL